MYFPDDAWLPEYGGGTCLYMAKNKDDLIMKEAKHKDAGFPEEEDFIKWHATF